MMESGSSNARLYCLTIAFIAALLAYALTPRSMGDKYDLMLFFMWATFIPWFGVVVLLPIKPRGPKI